jgi:hypothetical protein
MQSTFTQTIIYVVIAFLLGGAAIWWFLVLRQEPRPEPVTNQEPAVATFEECAELYPVMESYPPRCATPDGKTFTQDIGNELDKRDLVRITTPRPNAVITSPLSISGEARGNWYFEASFPIELRDANGKVLVQHYAEAQGEWMTTEFVPFKSTISFTKPAPGTKGMLILRKDNPSGLPEHDDALMIPVQF